VVATLFLIAEWTVYLNEIRILEPHSRVGFQGDQPFLGGVVNAQFILGWIAHVEHIQPCYQVVATEKLAGIHLWQIAVQVVKIQIGGGPGAKPQAGIESASADE